MTWNAACSTTSATVGFVLPGMIDDVRPSGGRTSSHNPQRGPEPSRRRSLAILMSDTVNPFRMPDSDTSSSCAAIASNLLGAGR